MPLIMAPYNMEIEVKKISLRNVGKFDIVKIFRRRKVK